MSILGSQVHVAPAAFRRGPQKPNNAFVITRVELSMPSPFFILIPPSFLFSHCPSQCEAHCYVGFTRCQEPACAPCKTPHVQFQFSSRFHHSPYLIKSALSGSRALEAALWALWTSKTNGDPSMLRLEADHPWGFCKYGGKKKYRGRVKQGEGTGDRGWKAEHRL